MVMTSEQKKTAPLIILCETERVPCRNEATKFMVDCDTNVVKAFCESHVQTENTWEGHKVDWLCHMVDRTRATMRRLLEELQKEQV